MTGALDTFKQRNTEYKNSQNYIKDKDIIALVGLEYYGGEVERL